MSSVVRGFRVTGRVQGVFFRQSTRLQAQRLGVVGSVRNLDDGSVEVFAGGAPDSVEKLLEWLRHGPAQARVDALEEFPVSAQQRAGLPEEFEVR